MAGIKISELPEAGAIIGNEVVPVVQNSCTKYAPVSSFGNDLDSIVTGNGLVGGGSTGDVCISINSNCLNNWNNTYVAVDAGVTSWNCTATTVAANSGAWDQSGCAGLNCVGDITLVSSGDSYITGSTFAGDALICLTTGCGESWDAAASTVASASGNWSVTGTDNQLAKFNATCDNIESSNVSDTGTLVTISSETTITGGLSAPTVVVGSDHDYSCGSGVILSGGDTFIVGGNNNTLTEVATTLCNSGLIGGTRNIINGGCNNVIIGGEVNCLCENAASASFKAVAIVGSLSSCIDGERSGVYSAVNATVAGTDSAIVGGVDHTTNCNCAFIFGGLCNTVSGNISTAVGGCCNSAGAFVNDFATAIGGACICAPAARSTAIGGWRTSAGGDDSAAIGGSCNCINDNAHTAVIAGGCCNNIGGADCYTFIGGGFANCVSEDYASIVGGNANCVIECNAFAAGGFSNKVCGSGACGAVIAGTFNQVVHERAAIVGGTSMTSVSGDMLHATSLFLNTLPTSDPGVAGVVWNDAGTLKISI